MRASSIGKFLPPLAGEGRVGATRVGIIGAGPAGLMLCPLLHRQGIASVVFERRSRDYVESRVRAGRIAYRRDGEDATLTCEFVAGCDGSHGISRTSFPPPRAGEGQGGGVYERSYPFSWLGILAKTPPASNELIYAYHDRGFALHSMRSPEISRLYLQVDADDTMDAWPEPRIWDELRLRLAERELQPGEIIEAGITPMRSMVAEPMQHGRLFLAGDAAHIVPATGAKGMNLALADVKVLAEALAAWYRSKSRDLLDRYSELCLRRVWRAEHFSAWMTAFLHRDPAGDPFDHKLRLSYLRYIVTSEAAATTLAENYVGFENA